MADPNVHTTDLMTALAAQARPSRAVEYFDFPESMPLEQREVALKDGIEPMVIESIGMVVLTPDEEKMAVGRAQAAGGGANDMSLGYEQVIQSLRSVRYVGDTTDRSLSVADASSEALWYRCHPAVRTLLTGAWAAMHIPPAQAQADFLGSRRRGPKKPPAGAAS